MAKKKGLLSKIFNPSSKGKKTAARPKGSSRPKRSAPSSKGAKTSRPAAQKKQIKKPSTNKLTGKIKKEFPDKFPFWARLKISKKRTTLVIDEEDIIDKKTKKQEAAFVHRESTHTKKKDYEEIIPNPDKTDNKPMYLKRPSKLPKRMFEPHNKELDMPQGLKERYKKNNQK